MESVQCLIITPTRELAIQITDEANKLTKIKIINILAAYGGKDIGSQIRKLKNSIHMIIATPGRLLDHISRDTVDLSKLKTLVIDEADQMLLMGFKKEVEDIIKETPKTRQTLCFSATLDSDVKKLAYKYMKNPISISVQKESVTLDNIKQDVVEEAMHKKGYNCEKLYSDILVCCT
ncbi:MAG: DEAD/DEAH box helicase [Fibrobacter sp.]|jgi:ATP-dependent RNA helicase DeaD|nr:DEAD/DEAH box helicase [Fibrobacter sp.]